MGKITFMSIHAAEMLKILAIGNTAFCSTLQFPRRSVADVHAHRYSLNVASNGSCRFPANASVQINGPRKPTEPC